MKKYSLMAVLLAPLLASTALAAPGAINPKAGDFMLRGRALAVIPQESSGMNIADKVKVDNSIVPELDLTYFFTPNIAAEVIAGVTPHNVTTRGGVDAGKVWLLPPTVTLQYHFPV